MPTKIFFQLFLFNPIFLSSDFIVNVVERRLTILRFKIERSLGYWEKNTRYADTNVWRQMRWAYQLLNIVIAQGNDSPYTRHMTTRVNMRNRMRFDMHVPYLLYVTEAQRVRFCKAYRILFDLLKDNMLSWPDMI